MVNSGSGVVTFAGTSGCIANFREGNGSAAVIRSQLLVHDDGYYWSAGIQLTQAGQSTSDDGIQLVASRNATDAVANDAPSYITRLAAMESGGTPKVALGGAWLATSGSNGIATALVSRAFAAAYNSSSPGGFEWYSLPIDDHTAGTPDLEASAPGVSWMLLLHNDSRYTGKASYSAGSADLLGCPTRGVSDSELIDDSQALSVGDVVGISVASGAVCVVAGWLVVRTVLVMRRRSVYANQLQPSLGAIGMQHDPILLEDPRQCYGAEVPASLAVARAMTPARGSTTGTSGVTVAVNV
jgi:hypothetical protein